ncbi:MAG: hypothetical protein ACKOC6_03305, partial [bacterium]
MSGASGIAALVAAGRYAIHHHGAEAGEELWSIEALPEGGAIAHGEQVLVAPHPLPSELEWRARLSPTGCIETLEVDWRVGTRAVRAEHAVVGTRWHARLLHGGHTREQEGDFPPQAEVAFGSHVLHMLAFRRYVLAEGAEHEYPALVIGPPWFAAEPGRQRCYGETCPQYLVLDDRVFNAPDFGGSAFVMSPPIRPLAGGHHQAL